MRWGALPKHAHGGQLSHLDVTRCCSILDFDTDDVCLIWRAAGTHGRGDLEQRLDLVSSGYSCAVEGGTIRLSSLSAL